MFSDLGCRTKGRDQQDKNAGTPADLSEDDDEVKKHAYTPHALLAISAQRNREYQGLGYDLWVGASGSLGVARKLKAAHSDYVGEQSVAFA